MNDLRFIRQHPDLVRQALRNRRDDSPLDALLQADSERRTLLGESEALKAQRNEVSRQIGRMRDRRAAAPMIAEMRQVGRRVAELDRTVAKLQARIAEIMLEMPNLPHESVPVGADDDDNVIVRTWGTPQSLDFAPRPHWGAWRIPQYPRPATSSQAIRRHVHHAARGRCAPEPGTHPPGCWTCTSRSTGTPRWRPRIWCAGMS